MTHTTVELAIPTNGNALSEVDAALEPGLTYGFGFVTPYTGYSCCTCSFFLKFS